jgi:flagellar assembly protein FliH
MDKYLFNTMFDEDETKNTKDNKKDLLKQEEKLSVEDAPTFSEEDLNVAKQIALKQGIQEGKAEVMSGIEREITSSLDTISLKLESLMQVHKKWTEAMNKDTLRLAHAIMKKLAPQLTRNGELNEVERTIAHAFEFINDQPKVLIQISQHLKNPIQEKIDLITSRAHFDGQVILIVNNELVGDDCRIKWDSGEMERSMSTTWDQIDKIVDRVITETEALSTKDAGLGGQNNEACE